MIKRFVFVTTLAIAIALSGFLIFKDEEAPRSVIRVGILPEEANDQLRQRYAPLFKYLSDATGLKYELTIPKSYEHLLEMFRKNEVELALFGGFTFLKAQKFKGAVPLVMRDVDINFISYFVTRADNKAKSITDFTGQRIAFGSKLSTSGHLMPRYFLQENGIEPEKFFREVKYSGTHDNTAYWVRDGKADLGAVNANIIKNMFADGRLDNTNIRIVWETPPYADYVWAVQNEIDAKTINRIIDAFLSLSTRHDNHAKILKLIHADGFLPARLNDFKELRETALALGLL